MTPLPIVVVAVGFLCGAALGSRFSPATVLFVFFATAAVFKLDRRRAFWIFAAAVFFGFGRGFLAERHFQEMKQQIPERKEGFFEVEVAGDPEVVFPRHDGEKVPDRLDGYYHPRVEKIRLKVRLLSFEGRKLPRPSAWATLERPAGGVFPVLKYGEKLRGRGWVGPPKPPRNFGEFDAPAYFRAKGIPFTLNSRGEWEKTPQPFSGFPFLRWIAESKAALKEKVYIALPYPLSALLCGLLFGERVDIPEAWLETFLVTGTMHILAVSGMNTALISSLFFLLFRFLRFSRKKAALAALICLGVFAAMTGAPPSVCRAGLLCALVLWAMIREQPIHFGALLGATALILVAWQPLMLFDLSFQLSFLATIGLVVGVPLLVPFFKPFLGKTGASVAAATLSAQIAVTPLLVDIFHRFPTYALIANLWTAPWVTAATASGLSALFFSFLGEIFGRPFFETTRLALELLVAGNAWTARLPQAEIWFSAPPPAWVFAFYLFFACFVWAFWPIRPPLKPSEAWKESEKKRRLFQRRVLLFGGFLWCLFGGFLFLQNVREKPFRIAFLSVGHGDAVVLQTPEGSTFVVDGGRETGGPSRWHPLVSYLRWRGVRGIEGLFVTHPDADHVGGLVSVLENFPVLQVYCTKQAAADSAIWESFWERIRRKKIPVQRLHAGYSAVQGKELRLTVWHPPEGYAPRESADNNASLGLLWEWKGKPVVLPGDLEKEGWCIASGGGAFPKALIALAAHHGRESGEPGRLAEIFRPCFVILSDNREHPASRKIFEEAGCERVLETAREGCIEVEIFENHFRWHTFLYQRFQIQQMK